MKRFRRLRWPLLAAVLLSAAARAEVTVSEVRIRGLFRAEAESVLQKLKTRAGQPYEPAAIQDDIRAVYAMGFFKDVQVDLDDQGRVTFLVVERPAIREWKIEGAAEVDAEELGKAVPLKRREILDGKRADDGARALRDVCREKGYYLAEVAWEAVPLSDGRNQVDLVYRVKEGPQVRVQDIHLPGVAPEREAAVRSVLATTQTGFWSWLSSSGTFKESDLERDREVVRAHYLNEGYVEVKVLEPRVSLTSDRRWLKIDLPVQEGETYRVGTVSFSGDLEFPQPTLQRTAGLFQGETFRSEEFRRAIQKISDLYADIGYGFTEVDPVTNLDKTARTVSPEFKIRKGDLVRIGRIEVRGNTKTRDRILRREMRVDEGDLYSASAIRRSRQRIEGLGFFEKVNLTTTRRPGTNLVDIDIEVEEKPTGSFSIGAGYSSSDKIMGMASVSQRNFMGLGYQVSLNANMGTSRETYSLTFNNPRLYDSQVYLGFDFYNATRSYEDYDKDAIGGDVKVGRSLGEDWRTRWTYRYEDADITNISDSASQEIKDEEGKTITSAVTAVLTHDTRDNPYEPHAGAQADLSVEFAGGFLGGDAAYVKYDVEASKYFGLWWKHVLTLHAQAGFIQSMAKDGIPIFTKYALGGINSVRGFAPRTIGPTDEEDNMEGGDKMLLFNVEYVLPLIEEAKVRGVAFFDAGNAWAEGERYLVTKLRTGAGLGIRWFSPMGPLRLEYAWNLHPEEDEDSSRWEFSIGGFF